MAEEIRLPKISANVDEATLTSWLKSEGDVIEEGEVIAEITTDKGVVELESPGSGMLLRRVAPENSTVPVGYILAAIGEADEAPPSSIDSRNRRTLQEYQAGFEDEKSPGRPIRKTRRQRVRATPAARRIARRNDIDLADVGDAMDVEIVDEASVQQYLENREP